MCVFPWTHLFVDPVGTFTTCCVGDPRPSADAAGVTIRAGQRDAIARHWRSQRMSGARADLLAGRWYVNVHTQRYPGGEIRAQVVPASR